MRINLFFTSLLGTVLGCSNPPQSSPPNETQWEVARSGFSFIDQTRLPDQVTGFAEIPLNSIAVGKTISLEQDGWRYLWCVESVAGTNVTLRRIGAEPAH